MNSAAAAALCARASLVFLCVLVAASAHDLRLECTDAATPPALKSVAARVAVVDIITRLFRCLEKAVSSTYKVILAIFKDVSTCTTRLPTDFFKCLARLNVPQKLSEIVNAFMDTINCASS